MCVCVCVQGVSVNVCVTYPFQFDALLDLSMQEREPNLKTKT